MLFSEASRVLYHTFVIHVTLALVKGWGWGVEGGGDGGFAAPRDGPRGPGGEALVS